MINGARLTGPQHIDLHGRSSFTLLPAAGAESTGSYPRRRSVWHHVQRQYWNEVADEYEHLYGGRWSRMENAWVVPRLAFIANLVRPTVVDLGCGTALGRQLIHQVNPHVEYLGVDISSFMVRVATADGASATIGSMDDLSFIADATADVVLALFSSFSFAFEPAQAVSEISRVLRPSGYAYLSVLSRRALSRLGDRGAGHGWYRTRGDRRWDTGTAAHFFDIEDMRCLGRAVDLSIVSWEGMNALSGVCETPCMWPVGRLLARMVPQTSHLIDVTFKKAG